MKPSSRQQIFHNKKNFLNKGMDSINSNAVLLLFWKGIQFMNLWINELRVFACRINEAPVKPLSYTNTRGSPETTEPPPPTTNPNLTSESVSITQHPPICVCPCVSTHVCHSKTRIWTNTPPPPDPRRQPSQWETARLSGPLLSYVTFNLM